MEKTKKGETMLAVFESDDAESSVGATTKPRQKRCSSDSSGSACGSRKKPKKASRHTDCKNKSVCLLRKSSVNGTKKQPIEKDEQVAVMSTTGENIPRPNRRLTNFVFYDSDERPQPVEMLEICNMYIAGTILPLDESPDEEKEKGIRCEHFGRLESWAISGFEEGSPVIWVSTEIADYECIEPRNGYKRIYKNFYEKAHACIEVYKKLSKSCGGNPNMSLDELVAGVVSSMAQGRKFLSGLSIESFVISQGEFIHDQLIGLDETCKQNDHIFSELPVLAALRDKKGKSKGSLPGKAIASGRVPKRSLRISDEEKKNETKRKVMSATTTKLINRTWGEYYSNYLPEKSEGGRGFQVNEDEETGNEDEETGNEDEETGNEDEEMGNENEEEEENMEVDSEVEEEETLLLEKIKKPHSALKPTKFCSSNEEITWDGQLEDKTCAGETLYKRAIVRGDVVAVGSSVLVEMDDSDGVSPIYFVEYMFENLDGRKMVHGRLMLRGFQTVLGSSANEREVFLTNDCMVFDLGDVKQTVIMEIRLIPWGYQHRKANANNDKIDRARAEERRSKGLPLEYYCRSLYWPERGAFFRLPTSTMGLGSGVCQSCKIKETQKEKETFKVNKSKTTFTLKGTEYSVKDFVYLHPHYFAADGKAMDTSKSRKNVGPKPFVVCHLLEIKLSKSFKLADPESTKLKVRRFFRPEDISAEKAHLSDIREVYYSTQIVVVPVMAIEGKCEVRKKHELPAFNAPAEFQHIFFCQSQYDPDTRAIKKLPARLKLSSSENMDTDEAACRKRTSECKGGECDKSRLATLDVFAGCGGLSEGLQQAGVSLTKWAIEYEEPAGEAFHLNHPDALMFINDCNVILRAIMSACGDADDCVSTSEATELAEKLGEKDIRNLPRPGQVDFINGGPPCQGFSGMNRFNQGKWSKMQCEMILAFLSFADYFRPRFFLLENVRNFVTFNKGQTFRLTLASLLEMGYQVRFGVLEAGAYGVPQSRRRAFIWAASPEETLPEWPEPMHVFPGPELKINNYAAVRSTATGGPFRAITVRDAIGDLPNIGNGACETTMEYPREASSWYQRKFRGDMSILTDHISKKMNELNLIRCKKIPKRPGADWHAIKNGKVRLSSGRIAKLLPSWLTNKGKRHNQWKGVLGRLDWEGHFPTSITNPQPLGKVGMCFHPDQDRILSVRECARTQGFPDCYKFSGQMHHKHRQVGNAVPPPLAFALGRKLKEAVERKHSTQSD